MRLGFYIFCNKDIIIRALKLAIFVGIILNVINQGEYLIHLDFESINLFKMGLTFFVPFCVSSYTAVLIKMKFHVGEKAVVSATLKCKVCRTTHEIKQNEIIPFCHNCNEKTSWKIKEIRTNDVKCRN